MYSANDTLKASKENNKFIKNHVDGYNNTKKVDKFYVLSDIGIGSANFRQFNLSKDSRTDNARNKFSKQARGQAC